MTGGRIKRAAPYIDGMFCCTYGDGVGDVNITALVDFHKASGRLATLTGVQPPGRFGAIQEQGDAVVSFLEKPHGDGSWVNGGFFVLEPAVFDYIDDDAITWERQPMEKLASENQLGMFRHHGFWRPMDTLRDKVELENLWDLKKAPWKSW
jgi:glucose-1-phosphate cytidylyltransferase